MKKNKVGHYIVLAVTVVVMIVPVLFTLIYGFSNGWLDIIPSDFPSFTYWKELFVDSPLFWQNVLRSIYLCVIPIIISGKLRDRLKPASKPSITQKVPGLPPMSRPCQGVPHAASDRLLEPSALVASTKVRSC